MMNTEKTIGSKIFFVAILVIVPKFSFLQVEQERISWDTIEFGESAFCEAPEVLDAVEEETETPPSDPNPEVPSESEPRSSSRI